MFYWLFYLYYPHSSLQSVSPLFWEEVEDWTVHVQTQCGHRWVHCAQYFFPNVAFECYNDPCFPSSCGNCQVKRQQTAGEQKHIPPLHRNMKELCLIKAVYVHQTTHTQISMWHTYYDAYMFTQLLESYNTHTHKNKRHYLEEHDSLLSLDSLCRRCSFIFMCVKTSHMPIAFTHKHTHRKSHITLRISLKMFVAVDASAF